MLLSECGGQVWLRGDHLISLSDRKSFQMWPLIKASSINLYSVPF